MSTRKSLFLGMLAGLVLLSITACGLYQIPSINRSMSWRLDAMAAYIRGIIRPVESFSLPVEDNKEPFFESQDMVSDLVIQESPDSIQKNAIVAPTITPGEQLPTRVILPSPSYETQDWNNCGPVTLSHYLRFYGWQGNQFDVSSDVKPVRSDRNVNVDELVNYVIDNNLSLSAIYRVGGDVDLLRAMIAEGFPVMIEVSVLFEDRFWVNDDRWSGHYLLVTGYDDERSLFVVQDPLLGADKLVGYNELEQSWQPFNRVYLLLFPPDQMDKIKNLLGDEWDVELNRKNALQTSISETKNQPDNAFAWFNLGTNYAYFQRYAEAADAYDQAWAIGLPQRMLRYQFGPFLAYFHSNRFEDLQSIVEYALQITPNSEEALLWEGWLLYRMGDKQKALDSFHKALEMKPGYRDASYAINYVQNGQG